MLERIDDISHRLLTFFLSPSLNSIILLIVFSWCIEGSLLHDSYDNIKTVITNVVHSVSSLVSKDRKDLQDLLVGPNAIPNQTALAAIVAQSATIASGIVSYLIFLLSIGLVLMVFLIDRLLFAMGWLIPPDVDFDYAFYGALNSDRTQLFGLNTPSGIKFFDVYGTIRSYLGEQSTDKFREFVRDGIVKGISRVESHICYTKSYILITAFILFSSILSTFGVINFPFRIFPSLFFFCVSLAAFLSFCMLYSSKFQQLVKYDVNSCRWLYSFNNENMKFEMTSLSVEASKGISSDGIVIPLHWLLLRFKISGFLNKLFGALWRRVPRIAGRGRK